MGLLFLLVLGSALGWLASIVAGSEARPQILRNLAAGVGGAVLAAFVVGPLLGRNDLLRGVYHVDELLIAIAGAALLLATVNLPYRGGSTAPGAFESRPPRQGEQR